MIWVNMKLLASLFETKKKVESKTLESLQEEMAIKMGKQQFQKLADMGLKIPVAPL